MEVSSTTTAPSVSTEVIEKAIEIQEQQIVKVLDSANEQSKEVTAQKTGMGNNINITG